VGLANVSTTVVNTSNVSANTSLLLQTNGTTTAVTIDTSQIATFVNTVKAPNLQGPAFSAYAGSSQTVSTGVYTLVVYNTKVFDTATCFNNTGSTVTLNGLSAPAYSFTPNVSGYYMVTSWMNWGSSNSRGIVQLYKNGSLFNEISDLNLQGQQGGSALIYLNGTGDYVQTYIYSGSATTLNNGSAQVYFQSVLVRSA
jgi:hypothetical protein